jgi:hypothetical protein
MLGSRHENCCWFVTARTGVIIYAVVGFISSILWIIFDMMRAGFVGELSEYTRLQVIHTSTSVDFTPWPRGCRVIHI